MSYIDDAVTATMGWEGSIPWMYLDSRGNVTVGCGQLLSNPADACALPFQSAAGSGAATETDVTADFRRVKAMTPDQEAGFYHADTSPILSVTEMAWMLRTIVSSNDASLQEAFAGWRTFPDSAKVALLDMEYNIGEGELLRGYPKMDAAIKAQDWRTAAAQCKRIGISAARNNWTKQMFLAAVSTA